MRNEPIRHHYIPQFILRNFCDSNNRLCYFDKRTQTISQKTTRDVFEEQNLYRDDAGSPADPVKIEKDLGNFEREMAEIIKNKLLNGREIYLTTEEEAALKLFFALMAYRSNRTKKFFNGKISKKSKAWYGQYQPDGDMLGLWKSNLRHIVNCRSFDDVWNHPEIDEPFKAFLMRDTEGYIGRYLTVVEAGGNNTFVIGDAYPVVISGTTSFGLELNLYDIYPISANRIVLLVNNGVQGVPQGMLNLREFLFLPPKFMEEDNCIRIRVKQLCTNEVQYINREIEKNAEEGFAFRKE